MRKQIVTLLNKQAKYDGRDLSVFSSWNLTPEYINKSNSASCRMPLTS